MSWITFEAAAGGLVVVQTHHVVAIYDEQGTVKLATAAGGVHILKGMTVQRAVALITEATEADAANSA